MEPLSLEELSAYVTVLAGQIGTLAWANPKSLASARARMPSSLTALEVAGYRPQTVRKAADLLDALLRPHDRKGEFRE